MSAVAADVRAAQVECEDGLVMGVDVHLPRRAPPARGARRSRGAQQPADSAASGASRGSHGAAGGSSADAAGATGASPGDKQDAGRDASVTAADGLPVVVLCHGFKGFRRWGMFPHLASRLAAGGRAVVLWDASHNGVDGIGRAPGEFTRLDLFREQTVTRHVEDLGAVIDAVGSGDLGVAAREVYAVGHSLGGAVALLRAAVDARITGLALLNAVSHLQRVGAEGLSELREHGQVSIPNARTGQVMPLGRAWFDDLDNHDIEAAAATLAVPALVLHGSDDTNVTPGEGRALAEWIGGARLLPVPGGDHTFGARHPWQGWTDPLELVAAELDAFLPKATPA